LRIDGFHCGLQVFFGKIRRLQNKRFIEGKMKKTAFTLLAASLALASCAWAQAPAATAKPATPKSGASKTGSGAHPASAAPRFDRALLKPALLKQKAPETYQVKFATTRGDFTVTVTRAWAPLGADRFYNLVKHGFYDNASFFRVVPNFVVQFGISANPAVSKAWKTADIQDDPVVQSNKKGYVTFATAGPNTRTTQVFINLKDNGALDHQGFAPFAQVTDGMRVVEMFYDQYDSTGIDQDQIEKLGKPYLDKGWPKLDSIKTATVVGAVAPAAHPGSKPAAKPKPPAPPAAKP
jgi:peptidyl-prolyl cis-trans isomerase A (cyclophilin A)